VIGINAMIAGGLALALPSNVVARFVASLRQGAATVS
jgi:S1-C subfamily serine protease